MSHCPHCNSPVHPAARFCSSCGKAIAPAEPEAEVKKNTGIQSVFILYFLLLLVCVILKVADIEATWKVMAFADILISLIIVAFVGMNFRELRPAIFNTNITWWLFPVLATGAIVSAIGIGFMVDALNSLSDDIFYFYMYDDTENPFLWSALAIAVQPAIFEELAFRGVMYHHLRKSMDAGAVIVVTGVLFAILHISPVSMIWLLPFGLLAAWMRMKTGHIWYGVVFHFFYNLTYVVQEGMQRGWFV